MKHCFTASMTAHSISMLSELKMSSFGPCTGSKMSFPSALHRLHSVEGHVKCLTVPQCRELMTVTCAARQGS